MNLKLTSQGWDLVSITLSAITIGIVGFFGFLVGIPWLFPSLGPTIAIQSTSPDNQFTRPWNIIAGHIIGLTTGLFAVYITDAVNVPHFTQSHALSISRVFASVIAIQLSMSIQYLLKARHQPAEATTLLIALGALESTIKTVSSIICGVVLITILGRLLQRVAELRKQDSL